jgi:hypothetical protein
MNYVIIDESADKEYVKELLSSQFHGTILAAELDEDGRLEGGVRVSADNESFESDDLPEPHASVSNGASTINMYHIGGATIFIESGVNDGLGIWPANAEIQDYLNDWDFGDTDTATGLAEFGLEPSLDEADEGDTSVRIWKTHYYTGTNAPHDDFVRDADGDAVFFDTYEDATRWIKNNTAGTYYLQHGEVSPADYTIVR